MLSEAVLGYIYVGGAVILFGSFGVLVKIPPVEKANVDAVVFQCYYSLAVFLTSWLMLLVVPFTFTWWGTAGAAMWVPGSVLAVTAIKLMGMATAQGIWSGTIIIVSFLWGAFVFWEEITDWYLAGTGLALLLIGILGISVCNLQKEVRLPPSLCFLYLLPWFKRPDTSPLSQKLLESDRGPGYNTWDGGEELKDFTASSKAPATAKSSNSFVLGLICALSLGVLCGSMMVPTQFTPEDGKGLYYVISFSIGVAIVTASLAPVYFLVRFIFTRQFPQFHFKVAFLPGFAAGVIWNGGNICSILATYYLGLTIGFPLTQCALLVSGLWGMIVFREITRIGAVLLFFLSAFILLGGAVLLALYG